MAKYTQKHVLFLLYASDHLVVFHGTLNGSAAYRAAVLARTGNVFHSLFPEALAYSMARVLFARAQRLA